MMAVRSRIGFFAFSALLISAISCNPKEDLVQPSTTNTWKYFKTTSGLPSNHINTLYEDKAGRIWVGTDNGLAAYTDEGFTIYTTGDGLLDNNIYAVLDDKDGDIWAGTEYGLNVLHAGQWLDIQFFDGAEITALVELPDHNILVATGGYGVYLYEYTTNNIYNYDVSASCAPCNAVLSMTLDSKGSVWVGSNAGVNRITGQDRRRFTTTDGLSDVYVVSLGEDTFGNMWVGGVQGTTVSRIKDDNVEQIAYSNGSSQNYTASIARDAYGHMWFGTVAVGLYMYDGGFMGRLFDGPPGNTITAMLSDRNHNLWVGTYQDGLGRCQFGVH